MLLRPGGDDHRGGPVVYRVGGQAEDLAAVEAVACPQGCAPGTEQGIDQVFPVLVGRIAER